MQLEITAVDVANKGKYKQATVTYKFKGREGRKTVMSFGSSEKAFLQLASLKLPAFVEVSQVEENGYKNWSDVQAVAQQSAASPASSGSFQRVDDSEKQRLIVRQSSVSNALKLLELQKAKSVSVPLVCATAEQLMQYVYEGLDPVAAQGMNSSMDVPAGEGDDVAF